MKHSKIHFVEIGIGMVLLVSGLYVEKTVENPRNLMLVLPYICIGLGCGIFGKGMGQFITNRAIKGHPDIQKQMDIEKKDERNIAIAN